MYSFCNIFYANHKNIVSSRQKKLSITDCLLHTAYCLLSFFGVTSISSSPLSDFLKFFIAFPMPLPISGSFPKPNIKKIISNTITNSVMPIPNMFLPKFIRHYSNDLRICLQDIFYKDIILHYGYRYKGNMLKECWR